MGFVVSLSRIWLASSPWKYTYRNLKVYLKHKATEAQVRTLLIPIGPYSLDVLEHLVVTFSAGIVRLYGGRSGLQPGQEFQDYQDLRVLEIRMDLAYFKHPRYMGTA